MILTGENRGTSVTLLTANCTVTTCKTAKYHRPEESDKYEAGLIDSRTY